MKPKPRNKPDVCPACGTLVPPAAVACPACGSDEETGWSERARYDALDLPDQDFDYQEFAAREFGGTPQPGRRRSWIWWIAVGLMLAALLGFIL